LGTVAAAAFGGVGALSKAASSYCEAMKKGFEENTLTDVLRFLRDELPPPVQTAEEYLTSFRSYHQVLQLKLEVHQGRRRGWITAEEAGHLQGPWKEAIEQFTIRATTL